MPIRLKPSKVLAKAEYGSQLTPFQHQPQTFQLPRQQTKRLQLDSQHGWYARFLGSIPIRGINLTFRYVWKASTGVESEQNSLWERWKYSSNLGTSVIFSLYKRLAGIYRCLLWLGESARKCAWSISWGRWPVRELVLLCCMLICARVTCLKA